MENSLFHNVYNPDVLSCIANLSNDEVFTPPELANKIIDMLPQELFENPDTTFLDPCCKSGVFLREIAKRLIKGLENQIPDLEKRLEHIFSRQLYGIAITELTSLLSRRSVYCSKFPSSPWSAYQFPEDKPQGNIIYQRIKHTWKDGKCIYCGASQSEYDRGSELETHAYQFIHNLDVKKVFNMKFDVIIGNPPYQMADGGGRDSAAIPLYHLFIQQAKKLNPRFLTMIVPARWYSGGRGLDDFRDEMLHDDRLCELHDFPETKDCFPGLNIRGGVCYFLWSNESKGMCKVVNHSGTETSTSVRKLLEEGCSVFIRYNKAISIFHKVQKFKEDNFGNYVSSSKPFGMRSNFAAFKEEATPMCNIKLYRFGDFGYINEEQVLNNKNLINRYKVLVSKASPGGDEYPHAIVSQPIISEPQSVCTETYLVIKDIENIEEAKNLVKYIKTRFFRFMMSLVKNTQNISKSSYRFVPLQDLSKPWIDEELYIKYGLTQEEIEFIESMIRPME